MVIATMAVAGAQMKSLSAACDHAGSIVDTAPSTTSKTPPSSANR